MPYKGKAEILQVGIVEDIWLMIRGKFISISADKRICTE
jgi:hypothetical protein